MTTLSCHSNRDRGAFRKIPNPLWNVIQAIGDDPGVRRTRAERGESAVYTIVAVDTDGASAKSQAVKATSPKPKQMED